MTAQRDRASVRREAAFRAKAAANRPAQPDRRPYLAKRPGEEIVIAMVPGLSHDVPELVEESKQATHDLVIRLTGRKRRSGVRWRIVRGREEARADLMRAFVGHPNAAPGARDEVVGYLRWIDEAPADVEVVLVVAMCEAVAR